MKPDTRFWLIDGVLVTAVTEAGETAVTLTITAPGIVQDARSAILAVDAALKNAADARRHTYAQR